MSASQVIPVLSIFVAFYAIARPRLRRRPNVDAVPTGTTAEFLEGLAAASDRVNGLTYRLVIAETRCGYVEIGGSTQRWVHVHRLWVSRRSMGDGSVLVRTLCRLADAHRVGLRLNVVPFGPEPYPINRDQLKSWYERHGFQGPRWKLERMPLKHLSGAVERADLVAAR